MPKDEESKQALAREIEALRPEDIFRTIGRIRKEAKPLEPLWGYFLFKKAVTSIVGDPGICKCVDEDTLLLLDNGQLVAIKEYPGNSKLLSLNKDLRIQSDLPIKLLDEGYKECLEITVNSGKKIVVTPEHPFLKTSGWQRADTLPTGDRIATLAGSDIFWDTVVSIKPAGIRHVWDISMPNRSFVANDFFVHNTTFGYGLASTLCLRRPFLDIIPEESVNALYMDFESSDPLVVSRANLILDTTEDIPNFFIYNIVDYFLPQIATIAIKFCKESNINLILIDNQTMAFNTRDENDNAEAARQMRFIRSFAVACNCAVLIFHHTSKANLPGTRKGSGAYARARCADIYINIEILDEDKPDVVRFQTVKNRLIDEKVLWYLEKKEGKFLFLPEPPLGASGQPTNTQLYKAQEVLLGIVDSHKQYRHGELVALLKVKGIDEYTTGNALKRLVQQGRFLRPRYGYYFKKLVS